MAEIPRTSTGKMMKAKLRETYKDWRWTMTEKTKPASEPLSIDIVSDVV